MAVGTVPAATADNGTFAPVVSVKKSKALRVTAVGVAAIFACAGLVALVGQASETNHQIQLVSISNSARDAHISALAREFLQHGAQMTQAEAIDKIRNWHNEELDAPARTQMLAGNSDGLITKKFTQALAGDSLLCEKRQQIIDLFDQLLKKLGGEELSANITLGKVDKAWKEALEGWLAVESEYRLTVEKVKDAREGAKFARDEYEKWTKTYKKAKQDAETAKAANAAERKELNDERELIKQLMRYIGKSSRLLFWVLHVTLLCTCCDTLLFHHAFCCRVCAVLFFLVEKALQEAQDARVVFVLGRDNKSDRRTH